MVGMRTKRQHDCVHRPIHPPSTTSTCPLTYALALLARYTTVPLKSSALPHCNVLVSIQPPAQHGRSTYPAGRYPRADTRQPRLIIQQRRIHLRLNVPRRNRIDRDPPSRPLIRKALGQLPHGALGRRVRRHRQPALEGQQRRKVDDGPAAARDGRRVQLQHVRAKVAAQREDGVEVDLHDLVEVGVGEPVARVPALDAGAVDEDADLVAVGEDLGRELGDGGGGAQVGGVDGGFAVEGEDGVTGGCCGVVALFSVVVSVSMLVCVRAWTGRCEGGGRAWTRIRSAPASARATATAWPMPRVPPVTTAVWPSRENRLGAAILVNWSCSRWLRIFQGTNHHGTRVSAGRLSWWSQPLQQFPLPLLHLSTRTPAAPQTTHSSRRALPIFSISQKFSRFQPFQGIEGTLLHWSLRPCGSGHSPPCLSSPSPIAGPGLPLCPGGMNWTQPAHLHARFQAVARFLADMDPSDFAYQDA